jgi:hypothetical protein
MALRPRFIFLTDVNPNRKRWMRNNDTGADWSELNEKVDDSQEVREQFEAEDVHDMCWKDNQTKFLVHMKYHPRFVCVAKIKVLLIDFTFKVCMLNKLYNIDFITKLCNVFYVIIINFKLPFFKCK